MKWWILFGMLRDQISYKNFLCAFGFEGLVVEFETSLMRSRYVVLDEYLPFFVADHIRTSSDRFWPNGRLRMVFASWGKSSKRTRSSIQQELSSSIRAQTWMILGKFLMGDMIRLEFKSGSLLSFQITTSLSSPICHLEPNLTTRQAFMMLCQTYNPFNFTSSSMTEQLGKYFSLNTL